MRRWLLPSIALFTVTGCSGLREIEAPPKPPQTMPIAQEPKDPLGEHEGRLTIDAVGGPAQVDEVIAMTAGFEENNTRGHQTEIRTRPICPTTPCVVDMHAGYHILRYSRPGADYSKTSLTTAEVEADKRSVIVHDLGYYQTHKTRAAVGSTMQTVGIVTATLGAPLLLSGIVPLGGLVGSRQEVKDVQDGLVTAGLVAMASGAGLLIIGEVIKILSRTEYQKGSTTQWDVPGAPPIPKAPPKSDAVCAPPAPPPAPPPLTPPAPPSPDAPPPPAPPPPVAPAPVTPPAPPAPPPPVKPPAP